MLIFLSHALNFLPFDSIVYRHQFSFDMQKIQKFQFSRLYAASKPSRTFELIDRDGHRLTFRVRNPKTRDSWKQMATSTYKADETGAFEEVLFSDGHRLRADFWRSSSHKIERPSPYVHVQMAGLISTLAA